MTVGQFAEIVANGGQRYGGSCISWGRSEKHNSAIVPPGHEDSFHMLWLAADLLFDTRRQCALAERFYKRSGLSVKKNGEKTLHVQALAPQGWPPDEFAAYGVEA